MCLALGCTREDNKARGLCNMHYQRELKRPETLPPRRKRENGKGSIAIKGDMGWLCEQHYVRGRLYPASILIAMYALKKQDLNGQQVHHNDGDTLNNRPSNLVVCEKVAHGVLDNAMRARKLWPQAGVPERPNEHNTMDGEILKDAIWLRDLLEDDPDVINKAIVWFDKQLEEMDWQKPIGDPVILHDRRF